MLTGPVTSQYVEAKVRKFKKRFRKLKKATQKGFKQRGIPVKRVSEALPADDSNEHRMFTQSHKSVFEEAHNQSALIGAMGYTMDYLSYHLLDHIVAKFDLGEVKVQMEAYKSDLQRFRERVPVNLFCQSQKRKRMKLLPDFQEVVADFNILTVAGDINLQVVDHFRQMYSAHYNLRDYSMVLSGIHRSGFVFHCTWLIPRSIVGVLMGKLPKDFFGKYSVSKFSIAGTCVYQAQQVMHEY